MGTFLLNTFNTNSQIRSMFLASNEFTRLIFSFLLTLGSLNKEKTFVVFLKFYSYLKIEIKKTNTNFF